MRSQSNENPSRFLVQRCPLPHESLSSFRQRGAWANGYLLFPILDERRRRTDPDRCVRADDLQWLSAAYELEPHTISRMTLAGIADRLHTPSKVGLHPPWWVRARYPADARAFGPMYCALCLQNDEAPYFRLFWRLGFVTHCPIHRTQLEDQCPECHTAPWPRGSGARETMSKSFTDFRKCWSCGLNVMAKNQCETGSVNKWRSWMDTGTAELGDLVVPSNEAFMALRAICQLFLRNRSRSQILRHSNQWAMVASTLSSEAVRTQAIEQCSVSDRARVVPVAADLLQHWPSQFLSFADACRLKREHFSGSYQLMPSWMQLVVDTQLARQNRWVTSAVLSETIKALTTELGRTPSQTAVRQRLKWSGEKGLSAHYQKRTVATSTEWQDFLHAVNVMQQSVCGAPRSYRAFLIDLNILVYCMTNQLSIAACRTVTLKAALDHNAQVGWKESSNDEEMRTLQSLVTASNLCSANKPAWLDSAARPRQVRKRLTALMKNFSPDLLREMRVFNPASCLGNHPEILCSKTVANHQPQTQS
jgi:hypothetical protein